MFIDPLTLFIAGEILVVYIIINVFLFYKSRLYNVLVQLLKELRFDKLRREQLKQQELANLRATNKDLLTTANSAEASLKSAGKAIPDQLQDRIDELTQQYPKAQDLTNSVELQQSTQWLRLRMLELEKELLHGNIDDTRWQELASEAISRLQNQELDLQVTTENRKDNAEGSRYTGQLETDLLETQSQFTEAKVLIRKLENELNEMKSISTPSDSVFERPSRGLHEDEIYQLRCDNFDLNESINKLKLNLQQTDSTLDQDEFIALLEQQLSFMSQYITSADIASGLMEKELSAAQKHIDDLETTLALGTGAPQTSDLTALNELHQHQMDQTESVSLMRATLERLQAGEDPQEVLVEQEQHLARLERLLKESTQCIQMLEEELAQSNEDKSTLTQDLMNSRLGELSSAQEGQKQGIDNLKEIIDQLSQGGDTEALLRQHTEEIDKLERFLSESDMIIGQLESELGDLQHQLNQLGGAQPAEESTRPNSDEDILEMESLLQQFISDIQSLLRMINELEEENNRLKAKQIDPATPPSSALKDPIIEPTPFVLTEQVEPN
ncbi:hypothetical protein [Reinekea sp.]|jgi:chromosome segregation ATPase|uniref:hypothetical protein n=1 Tax=Reinekea sp. TaxID=1970455 RepID=UPI002A83E3CC|nr:hypothetical protein [Reinekea sp.]